MTTFTEDEIQRIINKNSLLANELLRICKLYMSDINDIAINILNNGVIEVDATCYCGGYYNEVVNIPVQLIGQTDDVIKSYFNEVKKADELKRKQYEYEITKQHELAELDRLTKKYTT